MTIFHPVQRDLAPRTLPESVTRRAYEVYSHIYGEQPAMVDLEGRGCRGGFGLLELIAFLYAYGFPKAEWSKRVEEAIEHNPNARN